MLNEERVILMTKMASYEEGEGKRNMSLGRYFRGDYISIQLLRAFFSSTIAYLLGFGLYVLYDFETRLRTSTRWIYLFLPRISLCGTRFCSWLLCHHLCHLRLPLCPGEEEPEAILPQPEKAGQSVPPVAACCRKAH